MHRDRPHHPGAFVKLISLSLIVLAALSVPDTLRAQADSNSGKWDVNASYGPTSTISFTTSEGTWMNLDVSPDGSQIVFRGRHPEKGPELDSYVALLKKGLWKPAGLDVFVMNRDGSHLRQITKGLGGANWAPFFVPDGKRIIFASNMKDPRGGNFDLYLINADGTGLEQVTFSDAFDGFPMFWPDGKTLVFASNRHSTKPTDTNLFIADWK